MYKSIALAGAAQLFRARTTGVRWHLQANMHTRAEMHQGLTNKTK